MSNPLEISLENLSNISMQIMKKCVDTGEPLSDADILFLVMYKKEKARAMSIPTYKKFINGFKEILLTFKEIFPQNDTSELVDKEVEEVEVNTDEL